MRVRALYVIAKTHESPRGEEIKAFPRKSIPGDSMNGETTRD